MIMWPEKWQATIALLAAFVLSLLLSVIISADGEYRSWLPALFGSKEYKEYSEEVRGLWVTRFDWSGTDSTSIDQIVSDAAAAGFNVLYFQVRGEGDAFYRSSLVPWSRRLNTERILGQGPGWDPLERLVSAGHAAGLQGLAFRNVYPLGPGGTP
ncbi:MAG: family 10 glycosylhydrolase, partial [Candidatus Promineifilaceae bacterium]